MVIPIKLANEQSRRHTKKKRKKREKKEDRIRLRKEPTRTDKNRDESGTDLT